MKRRTFLMASAAMPLLGAEQAAATTHGSPIGLILVGISWCNYCKGAAQALQAATGPIDLPLLVASQDGKPIAPVIDCVDARGHPLAQGIRQVPTLLFVHVPTQQVIARIEGYRTARRYLTKVRQTLLAAHEAGYA